MQKYIFVWLFVKSESFLDMKISETVQMAVSISTYNFAAVELNNWRAY